MDLNHARLPIPPRGHCAADYSATLLLFTADHNDEQLAAGGAHEGTRTPTPEGTWT